MFEEEVALGFCTFFGHRGLLCMAEGLGQIPLTAMAPNTELVWPEAIVPVGDSPNPKPNTLNPGIHCWVGD